jgi:hypothetical protein
MPRARAGRRDPKGLTLRPASPWPPRFVSVMAGIPVRLLDVQITVAEQATDEYLGWLDVRPGEIFCVMAVS